MTNVYEKLMTEAELLGKRIDTEWAETHIGRYYRLENNIVDHFFDGDITADQAMHLCDIVTFEYDPTYFKR